MTHAPETRRHKSTPFFRRRFLVRVTCKSGTGFVWYQILAPIRTLFYSKPETGVRVTEMMIYHRLLFIFVTSCKQSANSRVVIYLIILIFIVYVAYSRVYFCAINFYSRRTWYEKPAPENVVGDFRRRFLARVPWPLLGIR